MDQPTFSFGRRPPPEVKWTAWFGARCILDQRGPKPVVDWVWDRRDHWPQPLPPDFVAWLKTKGTVWVDELPDHRENRGDLRGDSGHVFTFDDGPFHVEASCQSSHGYLYVGAWQRAEEAPAKEGYGWIIDMDHLAEPGAEEGTTLNAVGLTGPRGLSPEVERKLTAGEGKAFRMFDDDGELYYEGRLVNGETGFEPMDDFGQPNAGCTEIQYFAQGTWKTL